MKKSKICAAVTGLAMSLGMVGAASAITIEAGNYVMVLQALDSGTVGYGNTVGIKCSTVAGCDAVPGISPALGSIGSVNPSADTMGVVSVQSITKFGELTPYFTAGGADGFLTGIFGNLADHSVTVADNGGVGGCGVNPGACTTTTRSVGGTFSLWQNAAGPNTTLGPAVVAGTKDLNNNQYPTISDTGVLFLSGIFGVGAILNDPLSTFGATFNNGTLTGGSSGFLDFNAGSALALFDTTSEADPNGGLHDAAIDFTFRSTTVGGFNTIAAGEAIGAVAVPEPDSLALVALALLGAGTLSRRKKV